jgi:DNA-binding response OmpR family regulator
MSQQPRLRLIPERQEVQIGERIEPIISETEFKLLLYLYQRPGKICSLEELYFCALKGMAYIPGQRDKDWVHKSVWRAILDTAIYRLRKRIEPSAQTPVYLVTHPRLGLELRHTIV